jgi:hypothetical protein
VPLAQVQSISPFRWPGRAGACPPPPAQLAQQFQLLVDERVEDPVARLGYLMLAQ